MLLKPQQVQDIVWLVHGEAPPNHAASRVLLDPNAGFVQDSVSQKLQERLSEAETLLKRALEEPLPADASAHDREAFAAMQADQQANLLRAQAESAQYRANVQAMTQRLLEGSNDNDVQTALKLLVKRLFTSERLYPVLQARLQQGKPQAATPSEQPSGNDSP
jgi:hypothetical protein